jgi:hypothetical protein
MPDDVAGVDLSREIIKDVLLLGVVASQLGVVEQEILPLASPIPSAFLRHLHGFTVLLWDILANHSSVDRRRRFDLMFFIQHESYGAILVPKYKNLESPQDSCLVRRG